MEITSITLMLLLVFLGSIFLVPLHNFLTGFTLITNLTTPIENIITVVNQNKTFQVNASIQCLSATCNSTNVTLRRNSTTTSTDTLVATGYGVPFYIADGNKIFIGLPYSVAPELRYYVNKSGSWTQVSVGNDFGTGVRTLAVGDADNSNQNGVAVGLSTTTNEVRYFKNQSGSWTESNVSDLPSNALTLAIGDVDNDGKNEIVIGTDATPNELRYYKNVSGGWTEVNVSDEPTNVISVGVGDVDNDGKNEIVAGLASTTNTIRYYKNESGGWTEVNVTGSSITQSVAIGDVDNDGKNEIATTWGGAGPSGVRYYKNQSGSWTEVDVKDEVGSFAPLAIGDVDNDGNNEIVVGQTSFGAVNPLRYYKNQSGSWTEVNVSDPINSVQALGVDIYKNQKSCGNMIQNNICTVLLPVTATGALGSMWAIDTNVSSTGETNSSGVAYILIGSVPQYDSAFTDYPIAREGDNVTVFSNWWDDAGNLSYYIISSNNTGTWVNESAVQFEQTNNSHANKTFVIAPGNLGKKVAFQIYANNSYTGGGNSYTVWNKTNIATVSIVSETIQPSPDDWPMFKHDLNRTGYTSDPGPTISSLLWTFTTGDTIISSPAVVGNVVYFGSWDNNMYAVNASTGSKIWNFSTGNGIENGPSVIGGVVYFGSFDKNVYALSASTGSKIWNYTTGGYVASSPAVSGGIVYVGSFDHNVYALNATTGAKIWNYTTGGDIYSSPAVSGGMVYIADEANTTYALNATTGSYIWNYTDPNGLYNGAISSPAVSGGIVYTTGGSWMGNNNIYALNASDGTKIWNYSTGGSIDSSPTISNGIVYISSDTNNKIYALNAYNGVEIWSFTTGNKVFSSPSISNGKVYFGSLDHYIYALNAATGNLVWKYLTGNTIESSAAISHGILYIGSDDNKLYAIGYIPLPSSPPPQSGGGSFGPSPIPGQNQTNQTFNFNNVTPGANLTLDVGGGYPIENLAIFVSQNSPVINRVSITIGNQSCLSLGIKPGDIIEINNSKKLVYKCFDITHANLPDQYVKYASLIVNVAVEWVTGNNINTNSIEALRYVNNSFHILPAEDVSLQGENILYKYRVLSPGLSTFVVVGEYALPITIPTGECLILGFPCIPFLIIITEIILIVVSVYEQRKGKRHRKRK